MLILLSIYACICASSAPARAQPSAKSPAKVKSEDVNLVDVQSKGFEYPAPIGENEELPLEPIPRESPNPARLQAEYLQAEAAKLHLPLEIVMLGEQMRFQSAQDQWALYKNSNERASRKAQVPQRGLASVPTYDFASDRNENPPPRIEVVPQH
jgi:hypothetical protein